MDEVGEEENQKQTNLMDEVGEEEKENPEQINLESSKTFENIEETIWESNRQEPPSFNSILSKDQNSNNIEQLIIDNQSLPLPNIKNLRKWINNDKKAS